jgi:Ca-activated chloride channel family protein
MRGAHEIRQILLITDGCSNQGGDPVQIARMGKNYGVTVNVIGILNSGSSRWQGEREVYGIAEASGGMCRIVEIQELAGTMQMMTQQSMQMTIQRVVDRELLAILGGETNTLPPQKRIEVARLIQKVSDEVFLRLVLLLDVSASMDSKLPKVREAIHDLALSLDARAGEHEVAILTYPGTRGQLVTRVCDFCSFPDLNGLMNRLSAYGVTPTGPALQEAFHLFAETAGGIVRSSEESLMREDGKHGFFSSYIV